MFFMINIMQTGMRNEAADRFADCVVSRTENDLVLRMSLLMITAFVMPLISGLVTFYICNNYVREGVLSADSIEISIYVFFAVLCSIISFIMFSMIGRTGSHRARDDEWMESLIEYAKSKGCDVSGLNKIKSNRGFASLSISRVLSFICWTGTLVLLILTLFFFSTDLSHQYPALSLIVTYLTILFQFFFVMGPTIRFAGNHESDQVQFTRELKSLLAMKGIVIDSMSPAVPRTHRILWFLLTVVTLGLFHVILVIYSIYALNRHLYNQWAYEERLLSTIIGVEGATGIEVAPKVKRK